jgi:hypothetical protein
VTADATPDALDRLRALCLALPEATEKMSHGEPTWFVRKVFVTFAGRHHRPRRGDEVGAHRSTELVDPRSPTSSSRTAFWCAAPPGVQEALVASDPQRFFRPPASVLRDR